MSSSNHTNLHSRVSSWTQEVASAREPQHTAAQAKSRSRAPLIPTSANAGKRKRVTTQSQDPEAKRSRRRRTSPPPTSTKLSQRERPQSTRTRRKMADQGTHEMGEVRRSARERKPSDKARQDPPRNTSLPECPPNPPSRQTARLQIAPPSLAALSNADEIERPLLSPSKASGSPTKRTGSPKKGDRMLGKPKTDASLNMIDLSRLRPAIRFQPVRDVLKSGRHLPQSVSVLRERLSDKPGYIPRTLKVMTCSSAGDNVSASVGSVLQAWWSTDME